MERLQVGDPVQGGSRAIPELNRPGGGIFISYRREPAGDFAGRLYDVLAYHFGGQQVFLDVGIKPGIDYVDAITDAIKRTSVFLVVIDRTWHSRRGRKRLSQASDAVRMEIEMALDHSVICIIPVLMNDTMMPRSRQLPGRVWRLARRNAVRIRSHPFRTDAAELVAAITEALADEQRRAAFGPVDPLTPSPASAYRALRSFATARYGYDVEQVNAGLEDLITAMADPERCIGLRAPFFDMAARRATGYDPRQVDTFVLGHVRPPTSFDQGLRRLLADPPPAPPRRQPPPHLTASAKQCFAVIPLRDSTFEHSRAWLAFTSEEVRVAASRQLITVPYDDLGALILTPSVRTEVCGGDAASAGSLSKLNISYRGTNVTLFETNSDIEDRSIIDLLAKVKQLRLAFAADLAAPPTVDAARRARA